MSSGKMELTGIDAPPVANGEMVFEAPWQSRTFGMARALCGRHLYKWDEFRERLIEEIDKVNPGENYRYFDHFLEALTQLLDEKGLCSMYDVSTREKIYAQRKDGHDHFP